MVFVTVTPSCSNCVTFNEQMIIKNDVADHVSDMNVFLTLATKESMSIDIQFSTSYKEAKTNHEPFK